MANFEYFANPEASPILASLGAVNDTLRLHQTYNLDELMAPFMELLPDTEEPLHAVLTMQHIYDWPTTEIVSVLADAQFNPMAQAGYQTNRFSIQQPADSAVQLSPEDLTFSKREFVIPEPDLPDGFNIDFANVQQLLRRLEISEDVLCYLSEGVRRSSADRSPAYMVNSARQIDCISTYIEHLSARIEAIKFVQQNDDRISNDVRKWHEDSQQIFRHKDFNKGKILQTTNAEFPILEKSSAVKWQPPAQNYTEAQAMAEDCQTSKIEIDQMAEKSKSQIAKRAGWLAFVAQLDQWRSQIQNQPPKRTVDWRHDCVTLPAVQLQDNILPTKVYKVDNY